MSVSGGVVLALTVAALAALPAGDPGGASVATVQEPSPDPQASDDDDKMPCLGCDDCPECNERHHGEAHNDDVDDVPEAPDPDITVVIDPNWTKGDPKKKKQGETHTIFPYIDVDVEIDGVLADVDMIFPDLV